MLQNQKQVSMNSLQNQKQVNMNSLQKQDKRGGKRENAGGNSKWLSKEKTVVIRVPSDIKEEVLDIAHKIDTQKNS